MGVDDTGVVWARIHVSMGQVYRADEPSEGSPARAAVSVAKASQSYAATVADAVSLHGPIAPRRVTQRAR